MRPAIAPAAPSPDEQLPRERAELVDDLLDGGRLVGRRGRVGAQTEHPRRTLRCRRNGLTPIRRCSGAPRAPAARGGIFTTGSPAISSASFDSTDSHRPGVTNFVPVGLVVEDLDETVRFLALLGFDCGEPGVLSGEWIARIIGLENVTVETVMARAPDGSDMLEVVRFRSPSAGAGEPAPATNRLGLRRSTRPGTA